VLPRATYRLQLRQGVDLRAARQKLPYLAHLGVSHLYLSPVFAAREGSTHGYDVVDPDRLDPALGGERDLAGLAAAAERHGMALLLDVVPNHMAASPQSPAFADVLAHGPASRRAPWFDVDWGERRDGHAPLMLPFLGERLPRAVARGEIAPERRGRAIVLRAPGRVLPLDPATLPRLLAAAPRRLRAEDRDRDAEALDAAFRALRGLPPRSARARGEREERSDAALGMLEARLRASSATRRAVDAALEEIRAPAARRRLLRFVRAQPYRLAFWRTAEHLNYRRFFDVNELIAVRVEDPEVFGATHAKLLSWVERGWVGGLRIDHVDGLLDPERYLRRLRDAVDAVWPARERGPFPLYVEKILAHGEQLPRSWPVDGTTGYEFGVGMEEALLDPEGVAAVERGWQRVTGRRGSFHDAALRGKRRVLGDLLAPDLRRLVRLARTALRDGGSAPPAERVRVALRELIVHLPVYRTYADARGRLSAADRRVLEGAFADARRTGRAAEAVLDALEAVVLRGAAGDPARAELLRRLQQVSGPAAAKGVEDTALYAHVPLASRNEVGSEPDAPPERAVAGLHAAARARARHYPAALLAGSTHDTKRSADVRARLDVISEMPAAWLEAVARWRRWNRPHRTRIGRSLAPDPAAEWLFYQTLAGVWPAPHPRAPEALPEASERASLLERVQAYLEKAAREAKEHTRWIDPRPRYEAALRDFVGAALDPAGPFLADFAAVARRLVRPGAWNALSRTLVQLAAPGVPDVYQGDELFRLALVDPDNRRPVDFPRRRNALDAIARAFAAGGRRRAALLAALREHPEDGRVKLHLVARACALRREHPALFAGGYVPLRARGERADHVLAFGRHAGRERAVAVAPRLPLTLAGGAAPVGSEVWGDTHIALPAALRARAFRCALTGRRVEPVRGRAPRLVVGDVLGDLPVALLVAEGGRRA